MVMRERGACRGSVGLVCRHLYRPGTSTGTGTGTCTGTGAGTGTGTGTGTGSRTGTGTRARAGIGTSNRVCKCAGIDLASVVFDWNITLRLSEEILSLPLPSRTAFALH